MKVSSPNLESPDGVRLQSQMRHRLRVVAKRHGISTSTLIRDAIQSKLPEWEIQGVRLTSQPEPAEAGR